MVELGKEVQDRITGFTGIATSRTTYLQGCDRVSVQPRIGEDGKYPERQVFDEPDLNVIGNGVLPPPPEEKPGGPRPVASRADIPDDR